MNAKKATLKGVDVHLPLGIPGEGYQAEPTSHVALNGMTTEEKNTLNQIFWGLRRENASLSSGRPVDTKADVIRWLLWQVDKLRASNGQKATPQQMDAASKSTGEKFPKLP